MQHTFMENTILVDDRQYTWLLEGYMEFVCRILPQLFFCWPRMFLGFALNTRIPPGNLD